MLRIMKRRLFLLTLIIAFISAAVFAKETGMTAETELYSISVPEGWMATHSLELFKDRKVLCIVTPLEEGETFQSNCNVVTEELPGKYSEKEYLEKSEELLSQAFPNFEIVEKGKNYHIYTATVNGMDLKTVQFIKIKGKMCYIVSGGSLKESFDSYYEDFKDIYKSFKPKAADASLKDNSIRVNFAECSMTLPAEWLVQYENSSNIASVYSPIDKKTGTRRTSSSLFSETLNAELSYEEYYAALEESNTKNVTLVERGKDFLVYEQKSPDGNNLKIVQFIKAKNKKTYFTFSCTALESEYELYAPSFFAVAKSLKINAPRSKLRGMNPL